MGIRRNTKYNAATVTAAHTHFHLFEIHFGCGLIEASPSAGREVARIVAHQRVRLPRGGQSAVTLRREKFQIPSSKLQRNPKSQAPKALRMPARIELWGLVILWSLELGIWSFEGFESAIGNRLAAN
jgi:hypothetical protein